MIKIDMTSPDLDKQIELLKLYPEIMGKHFKPALLSSVKGLEAHIRPTIPVKTGKAMKTFGSKVTGKGIRLTGRAGWYDRSDPWYPNVLEYGSKPHEINSYAPGLGKYVRKHPGISAVGFMAAGFSAMKPVIESILAQANEGVVKDLALDT
jgi:hypothetical protein